MLDKSEMLSIDLYSHIHGIYQPANDRRWYESSV